MKKLIWTLSALALTGLCFTACGDDEDVTAESCAADGLVLGADADGNPVCVEPTGNTCELTEATCKSKGLVLDSNECKCVASVIRESCISHDDCETDQLCNAENKCVPAAEASDVVRYVRIDDMSTATTGDDPGADIDAIVLIKQKTSEAVYAETIVKYEPNEENFTGKTKNDKKVAGDPTKILGRPKSFTSYTNGGFNSKPDCVYKANGEFTFVSLGGNGGYIEVEMGGAIENGDRLDVLEVGGCNLTGLDASHAITAERETIKVQVAVTADGSSWKGAKTFERHGREDVQDGDFGLLSWTVSGL